MNADDVEKVRLARKTQWDLDKQAKKNARRPVSLEVCVACRMPARFYRWVARELTEEEKVLPPHADGKTLRFTPDGKVEELHTVSSPLVNVGEGRKAHMACARRRE